MDDILVIQMARMGDFLQTTPLLHGIKERYPSTRLWVLVDRKIQEVAWHCPSVDKIIPIDLTVCYELLNNGCDLVAHYNTIKAQCDFLHGLKYDMILNMNFSPLATIFSTLPDSNCISGYSMDTHQRRIKKDPWFVFLNSVVKHPPLAPFNLVDYFYYLHKPLSHDGKVLSFSLDRSQIERVDTMLAHENISDDDTIIALQLGSRHDQRQWPVEYFAECAIKLLQQKKVHILLLGTKADRTRGDILKQHMAGFDRSQLRRVHDFISKTNIGELAGLLTRSNLLISCDTGTMHLAAAVGCKGLALFFGPAFVYHTGPYAPENWIIQVRSHCTPCIEDRPQCKNLDCKQLITPDMVCSVANHILFTDKLILPFNDQIEVLKSKLDKWGIVYKPVVKRTGTVWNIQNLCFREMGKKLIDPEHKSTYADIETYLSNYRFENRSFPPSIIRKIMNQGLRLMYEYYSDPKGLTTAILDESMSFWHPWITYYQEANNYAPRSDVNYHFVSGMNTGIQVLHGILKNYH